VVGALRLGDHELAADQLDWLTRLEDPQLDEAVVLRPSEAPRLNHVLSHAPIVWAV
jgi:hypothetical protein